jgi:uncharacterized protein
MSYTKPGMVEEYTLDNGQRGIRALTDIPEGRLIGAYDGELVQYQLDERGQIPEEAHRLAIQLFVEDGILYGLVTPPGKPFYGIDYLNHSCEPNVRAVDRIVVVAARDIRAGEPLVADYRPWDYVHANMECWCPVPRCVI